ncbi:MAG: hypothetical protein NUV73_00945 [Candidatus Daviesbacteria bacterium]|nr:hypothetical protein [Candidatus Daviesbacteria bacterium]
MAQDREPIPGKGEICADCTSHGESVYVSTPPCSLVAKEWSRGHHVIPEMKQNSAGEVVGCVGFEPKLSAKLRDLVNQASVPMVTRGILPVFYY